MSAERVLDASVSPAWFPKETPERAVGIGVSPGDEFYSQPYAYISPWPPLSATNLPSLPQPGRWHTRGFVGVVATGEEIVQLPDRRQAFRTFLLETSGICRALLGA